jgi:Flp pilus assembly protein CpaB
MTYRLRNVTIAVALAVLAAILVSFYVASYQRRVDRSAESVQVYVAARDIPEGTPADELLRKGLVARTEIARKAVVPGAVAKPEQLQGLVAKQIVLEGEQLTARRFSTPAERGIRAELKGNLRAIQVSGDQHQLLAGTLRPGDRVDVLANIEVPGTSGNVKVTRIVLRDLEVLRAAGAPGTSEKLTSGVQSLSVQLAVTDTQVQKLFFAMKNADWWLGLRPPVNADDSPESVETAASMIADGLGGRGLDELGLVTGGAR